MVRAVSGPGPRGPFLFLWVIGASAFLQNLEGSPLLTNENQTPESLTSDSLDFPLEFWRIGRAILPEIMDKAVDWMDSSWTSIDQPSRIDGEGERIKRSTHGPRFRDILTAYKKDTATYSCLRKFICETLANSTLAEKSVKSPLGGTIMSMLGRAIERGSEVVDLVTEVVGDPDKCIYFGQNDLCDEV